MAHKTARVDNVEKHGFFGNVKKVAGNIMPTLSKLSKAFLLPIALLPIAGVFLGVGAAIAANTEISSIGWYIGTVMNKMGDVCFGNLPILFTLSVAMAYTKDNGIAALTALVGFLVMNAMQAALLKQNTDQTWSLLWHGSFPNGLITKNLGIDSLNTGVFAGIFVGAISAKIYNKFHATQLPAAFSFFSGTKLVPIITFFAVIPLSFLFMFFWPWIGQGLEWFGTTSGKIPVKGIDSLVFEMIERSLVPFGLHHVFYAPLWWTSAGGAISDQINDAIKTFTDGGTVNGLTSDQFMEKVMAFAGSSWDLGPISAIEYLTQMKTGASWYSGLELDAFNGFLSSQGDQNMMNRLIAVIDNSKGINFETFEALGLNLGRFQSGKFGFMLLGLPMAAVAMLLNVPKANRKNVMGIYLSAAFTCFLTGITEPIEYTFLFLAPWLFYGVHMPLAAVSFMLSGFMQTHVSMTISGGFIDYIVFGIIPFFGQNAMDPLSVFGVLGVSAGMGGLYFVAFYFAVKYGKVMVPGRAESEGDVQLFTKADFKASQGKNVDGSALSMGVNQYTTSNDAKEIARYEKAAKIIEFLGGEANITDVDSCASRLRLTVIDSSLANVDGIKSLGGSTGALVKGNNIQVVYGGEQEAIKPRMKNILEMQRSAGFKAEQKTAVETKVEAKPVVTEKPQTKPVVEKTIVAETKVEAKKPATEKAPVAKKTTAPVAKKSTTTETKVEAKKPVAKKPATTKKPVAKKAPVKKVLTETDKRAMVDGSLHMTESRQELQKEATELRIAAKKSKIDFKKESLRTMTKKEVLDHINDLKKIVK
ncbi:PTS transporter subunit EIIC [Mesoplasma photuris]|uniref:PTS transporter subunit EIIC n=1 Tax=Mesoplasma photuris TaxID=217731 RepID=UPI000AD01219|nr:PTS transporter subunit EIIC [Mesoplasma photuris]